MTVITKAIGETKPTDKMEQPLVVEDNSTQANADNADPEAQRPQRDTAGHYLILRRPNLRQKSVTLYCLLLIALLGMSIGVIGGVYIYRCYARDQMHRFRTGWYSIPYEGKIRAPIVKDGLLGGSQQILTGSLKNIDLEGDSENHSIDKSIDTITSSLNDFFKERFEIDLESELYEEIEVPDFRNGRQGRFIHDFNNNLTGIIDIDGNCCFVMPLNRERVLPPRNMYDLLSRMYNGYYEVNTETVRVTMRAVFPAISDRSVVGPYIARECKRMPIYRLEKIRHTGVAKRSTTNGRYGQFAGENIVEFDILNLDEVLMDK